MNPGRHKLAHQAIIATWLALCATNATAESTNRGIWFWDPSPNPEEPVNEDAPKTALRDIVGFPEEEDIAIQNLQRWGIRHVYNSYHPSFIPSLEDRARWNRKLRDHNIQPYLLLGDNNWVFADDRNWLINNVLPPQLYDVHDIDLTDGRFAGVHLDIEPHGDGMLAHWGDTTNPADPITNAQRRDLVNGLRDTYIAVRNDLNANDHAAFPLAADLPHWYDLTNQDIGWGEGTALTDEQERDAWFAAIDAVLSQVNFNPFDQPDKDSLAHNLTYEFDNIIASDIRIGLEPIVGRPWTDFNHFLTVTDQVETHYRNPANNPNGSSIGIDIQDYENLVTFANEIEAFNWQNLIGGPASSGANWDDPGAIDHTANLNFNLPLMTFDTAAPVLLDVPEIERLSVQAGQVKLDAAGGHRVRRVFAVGDNPGDDAQARLTASTLSVGGLIQVGRAAGSHGELLIGDTAPNVELTADGGIQVGLAGTGELTVTGDAFVRMFQSMRVGIDAGSIGMVTVTGRTSVSAASQIRIQSGQDAHIGLRGHGELHVRDGAFTVVTGNLHVGRTGGRGLVEIAGAGAGFDANVNVFGQLNIAADKESTGEGTFRIKDRGRAEVFGLTLIGNEFVGSGLLDIEPGGVGDFSGGVTVATTGTFKLSGGVAFAAFMNVVDGELLGHGTVNGQLLGRGTVTASDGLLTIGDPFDPNGIDFTGTTNVGDAQLHLRDADSAQLGSLTTIDGGVLRADHGFVFGPVGAIQGHGFIIAPTLAGGPHPIQTAPTGSPTWPDGLNVNADTVRVYSQNPTPIADGVVITGGTLTAPAGLVIQPGNTFAGHGNVSADLTNHGRLEIGSPVGTLNLGGVYTQTSDAELAVQVDSDTEFDHLFVLDTAALDGTLAVDVQEGYTPDLGREFTVLTIDGGRGSTIFDAVTGHLINTSLALAPKFAATGVTLRASIPGDLNFDDAVTVADLSTFALNFNTTPGLFDEPSGNNSWELGDFNADGAVTVADLSLLALNFGADTAAATPPLGLTTQDLLAMMSTTTPIPEPHTLALLIPLTLALTPRRPQGPTRRP